MRFKRADMPGLAIAVLGPVGLFVLLLEAYDLWNHHGSPLLGILSVHIAIGGGLTLVPITTPLTLSGFTRAASAGASAGGSTCSLRTPTKVDQRSPAPRRTCVPPTSAARNGAGAPAAHEQRGAPSGPVHRSLMAGGYVVVASCDP